MDDEMPTVFQELNIEYGQFTIAEYAKAKKSVKLGKRDPSRSYQVI